MATHWLQPGATNTTDAVEQVTSSDRMQLVGVSDYYHESVCLLRLRLQGALPASCDCDVTNSSARRASPSHSHGTQVAEMFLPYIWYRFCAVVSYFPLIVCGNSLNYRKQLAELYHWYVTAVTGKPRYETARAECHERFHISVDYDGFSMHVAYTEESFRSVSF